METAPRKCPRMKRSVSRPRRLPHSSGYLRWAGYAFEDDSRAPGRGQAGQSKGDPRLIGFGSKTGQNRHTLAAEDVMKRFKRVISGIFLLLAVFILFLIGSIALDAMAGAGRLDRVTNTTVPGANGGPDVRAYVARPAGEGPFPAVIMIHEFFGLNESDRKSTR